MKRTVTLTLETLDDLPDALLAGYCWGQVSRGELKLKVLDAEAGDYLVSRDYRK